VRTIEVGDILDGRYEILGILGQGGMGSVYRARQIKLDRLVALKVPNASRLADSAFMRRFEREARTCARFTHENIVTIHDVMVSENLAYICMEYVDGDPLDRFQAMHFDELAVADMVDLIGQICDGLHRAHQEGIVHRDIKPANIFITRDKRRVKIMDFGIARVSEATALTVEGSIIGTPYYVAPEQIRGENVTPATDIYSLSIVIYQIFTNHLVFDGEVTTLIYKHVSEPPPPPRRINPRLPESLNTCLLKGLEKDPRRRYQTTVELFDELREATVPIAHLPLTELIPDAAAATKILSESPGTAKPTPPRSAPEKAKVSALDAIFSVTTLANAGGRATLHSASTVITATPEITAPHARAHAVPNLGLLALKAILKGVWRSLAALVWIFARLPRWAKALTALLGVLAIAYLLVVRGHGFSIQGPPFELPKRSDEAPLKPEATPTPTGDPTAVQRSFVEAPLVQGQKAQPVAAALPRKPTLGERIRGWLPRSKKPALQIEVQFKQAPLEGQAGKLYYIEWDSRIVSGAGVIENYLVSLDGEKPSRVSARRPYHSWENLAVGKHRVTVQAESRDSQRSPPAQWEFQVR